MQLALNVLLYILTSTTIILGFRKGCTTVEIKTFKTEQFFLYVYIYNIVSIQTV
jgi:hypothetical protein